VSLGLPESGPLFIAHRAGNSLRGLRRAEAARAHIVEVDVFLRAAAVEARHSKTMWRFPLLWDRWKLERGWGSRFQLRDLLTAAAPETRLMVDIKRLTPGLSERIVAIMAEWRPGSPYLVCSQAWDALAPFAGQAQATPVYSVGGETALNAFVARFPEGAGVFCSIHQRLLNRRSAEALLARTKLVMSWPVNVPERASALLEMGVRGMITDRLELLAAQTG
jgi:glycerophosphoryl diester phosphodiesterase